MATWRMRLLTLRYSSDEVEVAFKRHLQPRLLLIGGVSSLAWSLGALCTILPILAADLSESSDWSWFFASNFSLISLSCVLGILALVHWYAGRLSRWNWEGLFIIHGAILLSMLPFFSPGRTSSLWQKKIPDAWAKVEGYAEAFQMLFHVQVLLQCLILPYRSCRSWIVLVCVTFSVGLAPLIAPVKSHVSEIVVLACTFAQLFGCWFSAWRIEERARALWTYQKGLSDEPVTSETSCNSDLTMESRIAPVSPLKHSTTIVESSVSVTSILPGYADQGQYISDANSSSAGSRIVSDTSLPCVMESAPFDAARMLTHDSLRTESEKSSIDVLDHEALVMGVVPTSATSTSFRTTAKHSGTFSIASASLGDRVSFGERVSFGDRISQGRPSSEFKSEGDQRSDVSFCLSTTTGHRSFARARVVGVQDASTQAEFAFMSAVRIDHSTGVEVAVQTAPQVVKEACIGTSITWDKHQFKCTCCAKPPMPPLSHEVDVHSPKFLSVPSGYHGRKRSLSQSSGSGRRRSRSCDHTEDAMNGMPQLGQRSRSFSLPSQCEPDSGMIATTLRGREKSLKLFLRRWVVLHEPMACCRFHHVALVCYDALHSFLQRPCDCTFDHMNGWQCLQCGIMCPHTANKCAGCHAKH